MRTYGKLIRKRGDWYISCEPHVHTRFKRVFERVSKSSGGFITLSDTPENCRELQWFMQRYPMEAAEMAYLEERARDYDRQLELIAKIVAGQYEPRAMEMATPARDYQRIAAELLLARGGLLLADDIGLGKTVSSFAALTDPATLPAVVVTLTHLPRQWQEMLGRFIPSMRSHIIKTGRPYRTDDRGTYAVDLAAHVEAQRPFPDVVLLSYSKLDGWGRFLADYAKTVIFDEVQDLRSGQGYNPNKPIKKYLAARALVANAKYRLGLSATPIYNYGGEIFNVIEVLCPDVLGSNHEFVREWCTFGGRKSSIRQPEAFGQYLREQGIMLRRTAKEVSRELPPVETIVHHVDADLEELSKIESVAQALAKTILAQQGVGVSNFDRMKAAGEMDYLMRMATGVSKAPYVAEFVRVLLDSGEKVVLYGWHHDVYRIWGEKLAEFHPVLYTGRESIKQKEEAKAAFCDGDSRVLIISLRAGAGLDGLQYHSRIVVHGELDWSPQVHKQCVGRVARDGQESEVLEYFMVTDHGSDPIIVDVLGIKNMQSRGILDPNAPLVESMTQTGANIKRLAESYLHKRNVVALPTVERPQLFEEPA